MPTSCLFTPVVVIIYYFFALDSLLAVEAHDGRIFLYDDRGKNQEVLVNDPVAEVNTYRLFFKLR